MSLTTETPTLPALQSLFESCMTGTGSIPENSPMLALARSDARGDAAKRFGIYAYAYRARLLEALAQDFPVAQAEMGVENFQRLVDLYIDAHPSSTPSLRWFGRHFTDFLQRAEPDQPLWAETAAFEWAQGEVFDAPDCEVVGLEAMAAIPPDAWSEMRLLLQPSMRRLQLCWNVPAIVGAHSREEPMSEAKRQSEPQAWVLWRRDLAIHWRPLGRDEAAALDAAFADASFGDICERLCEWVEPDAVALHAAGLLKRWLSDELVSAIELPH